MRPRTGLRRPAGRRAYQTFVRELEPLLDHEPRAHLFARPPIRIGAEVRTPPVGIHLVGGDPQDTAALGVSVQTRTAAMVTGGSTTPAEPGEWTVIMRPGDRLAPTALERVGQAAAAAPHALIITADHDELDRRGRRRRPHLHPGPSPDSRAAPMFKAVRCQAISRDSGTPAATQRVHIPAILMHASGEDTIENRPAPDLSRVPDSEPRVEVVLGTRNGAGLLGRSVDSLLATTDYRRLTVRVIDNGSTEGDALAVLERLVRDPRVIIDRDPRPFNFSALNHAAAVRSDADVLVFLNNDTEITDPGWLETLLAHALRPEVGAVAPLLLYPDGRVQHAGVAIGIHGWAGHPFAGLKPDERTPFGAATDGTRNWMAVTAACMVVERRKYLEVGGFDEAFQVGGGDVDLCLRLTAAGYRSLCVPATTVIHDESATRDPAKVPPGDFEASRRSYGAFRTVGDPFYHPALTLQDTTCRLRGPGEPDPPA